MNADTEKSEMLTVYDQNLNPAGEFTRSEVHERGLLHRTIRLWAVQGNAAWFQKRADTKKLFPGRLDAAATGHVDPGETPLDAALRETSEELGLALSPGDAVHAKDVPFPFTRPDGHLDNELASVYVYRSEGTPAFRPGPEVSGLACLDLSDYADLVSGKRGSIPVQLWDPSPDGPVFRGTRNFDRDGFCCLNSEELAAVRAVLDGPSAGRHVPAPVPEAGTGTPACPGE